MDRLNFLIKNICAFIMLTSMINNLLHENVCRKYIRFFSGVVVVIMLCEPVLSFLSYDTNYAELLKSFKTSNGQKELLEELMISDGILYDDTVKQIVSEIIENEGYNVEKVKCMSDNEHNIKFIKVFFSGINTQDAEIENVKIDSEGNIRTSKIPDEDINKIKGIIVDTLGVKAEQIDISFLGRK